MKLHLTFEKSDFENMRAFDKAVKRQLGQHVYTSADYLCFYFDFPSELKAMLRPYPPKEQLEFDLESSVTEAR